MSTIIIATVAYLVVHSVAHRHSPKLGYLALAVAMTYVLGVAGGLATLGVASAMAEPGTLAWYDAIQFLGVLIIVLALAGGIGIAFEVERRRAKPRGDLGPGS